MAGNGSNPNGGFLGDPTSLTLLGALAGLGQAGQASRLPITSAQVWGGLGGGLLAGQQAALKSQQEQQGISKGAIENANQLDALRSMAAFSGQPMPSLQDIRSGKFQGLDWQSIIKQWMGGQSPAPQLPGQESATPSPDPQLPAHPNMAGGITTGGAMQKLVAQAAAQYNIDPGFAQAHIQGESGFNPSAVGPAFTGNSLHQGSPQQRPLGLAQFAPDTAKTLGIDPMNPAQAADGYGRHFSDLLAKNDGNYVKATEDYGTIPHNLKNMDSNQQQVYQAAVAANARAASAAPPGSQVAQVPPSAAAGAQPQGGGGQGAPANIAKLRLDALIRQRLGYALTPVDQAAMAYQMSPDQFHLNQLYKVSGVEPVQVTRPGGMVMGINPQTGKWEMQAQNPLATPGGQLVPMPGGGYGEVPIPGAAGIEQGMSTAKAAGPATFKPEIYYDQYGNPVQGTAAQAPQIGQLTNPQPGAPPPAGGPIAAPGAAPPPSGTPLTPETLDLLRKGGMTDQQIQQIQGMSAAANPSQRPEAAPPTFPVQTPVGQKDISKVTINDMFPGGQGIPQRPAPPPGMGFGPPNLSQQEMQKDDVKRLETYNNEAQGNPKMYQDLAHLQDVLNAGFSTSHMTKVGADYANIAHGLGIDWAYPRGWAPANAAEFDKASTDLVFAAVKKLAGQVKVAEITGYSKANPAIGLPKEANWSIINDVMSAAKWQDARAKLATEYVTEHPGAPLGTFDYAYNNMAPLSEVTNRYKGAMRQVGAVFPEDGPAGGAEAPAVPASSNAAPLPKTAISPNGHRLYLQNNQWYDSTTNQPFVAPPIAR